MWLAVLGPLVVRPAHAEVRVAAAKQRVVLAALAVRAGQVVSFDELAETVWDGAPPLTARVTLRNYVKCLRQLLGPAGARIITHDPGYLIQLAAGELDVLRFGELSRQGGAAVRAAEWPRASGLLGEALGLWRGEPLADIPSDALRWQTAPRLERLRLQALEWRLDADLNLGRHADLVPELQGHTAGQPLHERFHAQLMLALYRSGRGAEALAAYDRARGLLARHLGAEPGPELRDLHLRILREDTDLAIPACRMRPPGPGRSAGPGRSPGPVRPRARPDHRQRSRASLRPRSRGSCPRLRGTLPGGPASWPRSPACSASATLARPPTRPARAARHGTRCASWPSTVPPEWARPRWPPVSRTRWRAGSRTGSCT